MPYNISTDLIQKSLLSSMILTSFFTDACRFVVADNLEIKCENPSKFRMTFSHDKPYKLAAVTVVKQLLMGGSFRFSNSTDIKNYIIDLRTNHNADYDIYVVFKIPTETFIKEFVTVTNSKSSNIITIEKTPKENIIVIPAIDDVSNRNDYIMSTVGYGANIQSFWKPK